MQTSPSSVDTEYMSGMIGAYVPDADQYDPRDVWGLAVERDQEAASLVVESQLDLERAAQVINGELDKLPDVVFTGGVLRGIL